MLKKIKYYYNKDKKLFIYKVIFKIINIGLIKKIISSKTWLRIEYYIRLNKQLNLSRPQTFNEKLQWLKLHDKNPLYTILADKYRVRRYIKEIIGEEYLIPLLGVYNNYDEIDFDILPDQFVLKPNHTSGDIYICKDKTKIDKEQLKDQINKCLKRNYFWVHREWPYKNIKPKIICEKLLKSEDGQIPNDYKFHCFNGEVEEVMVCIERYSGKPKFFFFDKEWNLLRYNVAGINAPKNFMLPKPKKINEMVNIAKKLSVGFPFVRVDLYCVNNKIYFGELTFFPQSGYDSNIAEETDLLFGNRIKLNEQNS